MQTGYRRIEWIEFLRVVSAIWVFTTHYVVEYRPDWVVLWNPGMPMVGITGKLAMAMFLIILGYLTALVRVSGWAMVPYLVKRYLRLCIPLLAVTSIAALTKVVLEGANAKEMADMVFRASFLLDMTELCTQAWCLRDFLIAIVLITVLGNNRVGIGLLALAGMTLYRYGQIWIAIAVLGAFLVHAERLLKALPAIAEKILFSVPARLVLLAASFAAIRRPEGYLTYMFDGFACAALFEVIAHSPRVQKWCSAGWWVGLGKVTYEFYLLHVLIFPFPNWLAQTLFGAILSVDAVTILSLLMNLFVSFAAACVLNRLLSAGVLMAPIRLTERWQTAWKRVA